MSALEPLRPANSVPETDLVELTHAIRAALLARGEFLPGAWVEEAARDLRSGALHGWVDGAPAHALAFLSVRIHRAYGHLHVGPGGEDVPRGERLLLALAESLPAGIDRLDAGATGLSSAAEEDLRERIAARPGWSVIERFAMDRPLSSDLPADPVLRAGIQREPASGIDLAALGRLDWVAFAGTADEGLVAETEEEDARLLEEIRSGRLGRFLEPPSIALVTDEGHLLGFLLCAEQSPQRAVFLDLVVHPAHRHEGLGRAMVDHGLRAAAALGYREVRLWVTSANENARRLYDRTGFRRAERALIYRFDRPPSGKAPQSQRAR